MEIDPNNCFKVIDHTADLALEVNAEILPDIYKFAALGLEHLLCDLDTIRPEQGIRFHLEGTDLEDLLIRMLSELIFSFSRRKMLFSEFIIELLTHEKVVVYAKGEEYDETRHILKHEIKAATYHKLEIEPTNEGFTTTIVLDV